MIRASDGLRAGGFVMLFGTALLTACERSGPTEAVETFAADAVNASRAGGGPSGAVEDSGPDVALEWFHLAYALTRQERLSPPVAARAFGYLGVTLYESVVPGTVHYRSLAGQLNGLGPAPSAGHGQFYWPAVANAALAQMMRQLYGSAASHAAIAALETAFVARFRAEVPPGVVVAASKQGQRVADYIRDWSLRDGFAQLRGCAYTAPGGQGLWQPTPPAFLPPLEPCWGLVRPFVLPSGGACASGPPPAYSAEPTSAFFQEAKEVYDVVNSLTLDQLAVALFWSDDPGTTGTPPGHSTMIAAQVIEQLGLTLDVAAETFAKVGIANADAFIACWATKYQYNLLRPVTYVHTVLGDAGWATPLVTPPFPEFTSGHSAQSGATARVLTDLFGDVAFTDRTHAARGLPSRSFSSFFDAAHEAAISRFYGGIHFRSAIERGIDQGECVGRAVSALEFRRSVADP
jgi:hypothetical protein